MNKILHNLGMVCAGVCIAVVASVPLTYLANASVYNDINPLNWDHYNDLNKRVFELADSDKNGLLSLVEIDDMYKRAGIDIQFTPFRGNEKGIFQKLGSSQLEMVIASYESEKR